MKILVGEIPEEGSCFKGEDPSEILELENNPFIKAIGDVQYVLEAQHVLDELIVRGSLSVKMDLKCTRCSEFFSTTVTDSAFLRAYSALKEVDDVDLTEDIREDLLLYVPSFPVCNKACKGLCTQCGINLNEGTCTCAIGARPNPWSALNDLNL